MLKTLLKKQLLELTRNFFYNAKKNKARPKKQIIGMAVLYFLLFYVFLGVGVFGAMAYGLSTALVSAGHSWMYFLIMSSVAIVMGVFGSVFSTYSSLYLATDNDLLLSMPIPVRYIMASRLSSVYLVGLLYSSIVMIPSLVVYYMKAQLSLLKVICPIIMALDVTLFIFILSVALGWVVARFSMKVRNKSLVTTAVALIFIAAYYYFYMKAMNNVQEILASLSAMVDKEPTGFMRILRYIGSAASGKPVNLIVVTASLLVLLAAVYVILNRTFIKIVTTKTGVAKIKYREKAVKARSAMKALTFKETKRLTSSSGYMLNCALGTLLMPLVAVALIIKGNLISEAIVSMFGYSPAFFAMILAGVISLVIVMNDISAPSVSLEGKTLWIVKTLPVSSLQVLHAKMWNHVMFTLPSTLILTIAGCIVLKIGIMDSILLVIFATSTCFYQAMFGLFVNLKKPNLSWTNEITVIKQSFGVFIVLLAGWLLGILQIGTAVLLSRTLGARSVLVFWTLLMTLLAVLLDGWIRKKGTVLFEAL